MSNSEGGSDSEVEMQVRRQTREQITPTQHHHSSTNTKAMKDYANFTFCKKNEKKRMVKENAYLF